MIRTSGEQCCRLCGGKRISFFGKGKDRLHFLEGRFDLCRCDSCGLIFIYPFLDQNELARYYPEEYAPYQHTEKDAQSKNGKILYYLCHPVRALNALIYSKILGQNRDLSTHQGACVLDIGCGNGAYLLKKAREGAQCFGVDISRTALGHLARQAPRIRTFCGNVWDADLERESFDLVNLSHVLEHVTDIDRLLDEVRRILKKDGFVRIQVPNAASLTHRIFGRFWIALDVPRHVYVFSTANLKSYLCKKGFQIERTRTIENAYDLFGSMLYSYNALFRRKHKLAELSSVWDNEWFKLLLSPYALVVNPLRIGDTLELIARKKLTGA